MKKIQILCIAFFLLISLYPQKKLDTFTTTTKIPKHSVVSIRNDEISDEVFSDKNNETVNNKSNDAIYDNQKDRDFLERSKEVFKTSLVQTLIQEGNEPYLTYCVVTETMGSKAGTIWVIATIRSNTQGNDKIGIYKYEQGNWSLQTYIYTFRYLLYHIDAEIVEKNTGEKVLWIVAESLASLYANNEIYTVAVNLNNLTQGNILVLSWPGASLNDSYYCPRITTDNYDYPNNPSLFIVASVDSMTQSGGHLNAQKFAYISNAYDIANFQVHYRPNILPIYWPDGGASTQYYLYSDIAYYRTSSNPDVEKLMITYSNVPDYTRIWLTTCNSNGSNAQFYGTVTVHDTYQIGKSVIASPRGALSSQLMIVFEENYQNSGDWDIISVKTNNLGSNWMINFIETSGSAQDFIPHLGTITSRPGIENEYYISYSFNNPADSVIAVHSNDGAGYYWDEPVKMSYSVSDFIQSAVGFTNTPGEMLGVWSNAPTPSLWQLRGTFYPGLPTTVDDKTNYVNTFQLSDNYPNPFNPGTRIKYNLPFTSQVIIKVFDVLGNEIETLVNEEKLSGTYEVSWIASNLSSGIYFYQLQAGSYIETKKMILLK